MQCLEVSGAVRPIYGSLGLKRLNNRAHSSKGTTCFDLGYDILQLTISLTDTTVC